MDSTPPSTSSKRKRTETDSPSLPSPEPSPKRPTSSTTTIVGHATWTNGNFEVITTDNVRFRVPDYLLFASSKVFADASAHVDGHKKIKFMGRNETSEVFEMFLTFISEGALPDLSILRNALEQLIGLAFFMKKWDCGAAYKHLLAAVKCMPHAGDPLRVLQFFCFAAALDEPHIAERALVGATTWGRAPKAGNGVPGEMIFDVNSWPVWTWHAVKDPNYLYALSRAVKAVGHSYELPFKFARFLKEAKEEQG